MLVVVCLLIIEVFTLFERHWYEFKLNLILFTLDHQTSILGLALIFSFPKSRHSKEMGMKARHCEVKNSARNPYNRAN